MDSNMLGRLCMNGDSVAWNYQTLVIYNESTIIYLSNNSSLFIGQDSDE